MPSPPHTESPAELVNFIFRQLPDEVVNELKDALHGGPHEAVISVIGGIAVAAGQDTVATGLVQNLAEDSSLPLPHGVGKGGYSIMVGDAIFEASAQSPEAGGADAAAKTVMTVSDGDFIIKFVKSEWSRPGKDASASSELSYIALNINGWSPAGGPVVIELDQSGHQVQPDGPQPTDGNYAAVIATADAHGAHSSLAATTTIALTVENQFSLITGISVVGV